MTRTEVVEIRERLVEWMKRIERDLRVKITVGRCTYATTAVFKVEVTPLTETGEAVDTLGEEFKRLAELHMMRTADLGRVVTLNGAPHKILGARWSCRRYPIICENQWTGKRLRFTVATLRTAIQAEEAA